MMLWNVTYIPADGQALHTGLFVVEHFANVKSLVQKESPGAAVFDIVPIEPTDSAWLEMRHGVLWHVSEHRAECIVAQDCTEAAGLMRGPHFPSTMIANALDAERTAPWALIFAGYEPEAMDELAQRLGEAAACSISFPGERTA